MPERYLGRTIGKYRVIRHLGTGAFSWVYEAVDQDLEIPVALKILRPEFAGQAVAEGRFRREAATAAKLRHPHIVTVRDVGLVDGAAFVAMDLYPLTLGRRLTLVGRLPEADVVRLGIGIAAALAVAHASQIVHRDIKPDNILLDANGEAVVADFGLARALAASTSVADTNAVQGTPHYFSPEQARGHDIDGRSDLYALGVTLYRAATGFLPFEGDDWYAIARQHVETPPPPPRSRVPDLSPEFEALLLRLLAKDPAHRYASALHVVDALAALPSAPETSAAHPRLGTETVESFRPSPPAPSRVWPVAAVLLISVVGWMIWERQQGSRPPASPPQVRAVTDTESQRPSVDRVVPPPVTADSSVAAVASPARPRPSPAVPRTVHLDIATSDSAAIYVDNRQVGFARWSGDIPPASRLAVRAVLADASTSCTTALRDTVLTGLRAGQRIQLDFTVRACAVVRYRVQPRDARVQFVPLDGGRSYETRADSVESYSLPVGRYLMRISAPYCIVFSDTVVVTRNGSSVVVPRKLVCS